MNCMNTAFFRDASTDCPEGAFLHCAPEDVRFVFECKGNGLIGVYRGFYQFRGEEAVRALPLAPETDYLFDGRTLTVKKEFLLGFDADSYCILTAEFERGQGAVLPIRIYAAPPGQTVTAECFDAMDDGDTARLYQTAGMRVSLDRKAGPHGGTALRIDYDFADTPDDRAVLARTGQTDLIGVGKPVALCAMVHGDRSYNLLTCHLFNRYRWTYECTNPTPIDWEGWKRVVFRFAGIDIAEPAFWKLPVLLEKTRGSLRTRGTVWFDDIHMITDPDDAVDAPEPPHPAVPVLAVAIRTPVKEIYNGTIAEIGVGFPPGCKRLLVRLGYDQKRLCYGDGSGVLETELYHGSETILSFRVRDYAPQGGAPVWDLGCRAELLSGETVPASFPSVLFNCRHYYTLSVCGLTKGFPAFIRLRDLRGRTAENMTVLVLDARDRTGDRVMLPFDRFTVSDGDPLPDFFTDPSLPDDAVFTLAARDGNGLCSNVYRQHAAPKADYYTLTPMNVSLCIAGDPCTSAAVNWYTDFEVTTSAVEIAPASESGFAHGRVITGGSALTAESDEWAGKRDKDDPRFLREACRHFARIDGLAPGTRYIYRLGDAEGLHRSETFCFTTPPECTESFSFLCLGDNHGSRDEQFLAFNRCMQTGLDLAPDCRFALLLGDLVNEAENARDFETAFRVGKPYFTSMLFAPTPGNHEHNNDLTYRNYLAHWNLPPGGPEGFEGLFYSFDYQNAHFTSILGEDNPVTDEMVLWLDRDLAGAGDRWRIVLMHAAPFSGRRDMQHLRKRYQPVFDKYRVELVFGGHEHLYVRSTMRGPDKVPLSEGTTYVTVGSTGRKFYNNAYHTWQDYVYGDRRNERKNIAVTVRLCGDSAEITARTVDGETADRFVVHRNRHETEILK